MVFAEVVIEICGQITPHIFLVNSRLYAEQMLTVGGRLY